jgi:DNA-binding beta-propeller fold protein YncE
MIKHIKGTALFFILLLFFGCAPRKLPEIMWPLPPEIPRIRFVRSFRGAKAFYGLSAKDLLLGVEESRDILMKPHGVHVDRTGRIYVGDTSRGDVQIFDSNAKRPGILTSGGRSPFVKPIGITTDAQGRVYVADSKSNGVFVFDKYGKFLKLFAHRGTFRRPAGVAVDDLRKILYVVDNHQHKIFALDQETGEIIKTIGKRGEEEGEFNFPTHIALDKDGDIYVVDTMNGRVQVFDPEGRFLTGWGRLGDGPGMFARPKGIAIDSEGHIYVVDAAFNNIQIFNDEGQLLMAFGEFGNGRGQQILPAGIAIDTEDKIYVVDQWNARVNIYEFMGEQYKARQGGKK